MMGALFALAANPAHAVVEITSTRATSPRCPIAITDFLAKDGVGKQIPTWWLRTSSVPACSQPIDSKAFIEKITNPSAAPRFQDWRTINAQALVTGQVVKEADGRLRAEFRPLGRFRRPADHRPAVFHAAGKLPPRRPHHPMIYEKDHGREGLLSTPASCSWPKAVRRMPASASSRSWTRTASMSVRSPIPTTSF